MRTSPITEQFSVAAEGLAEPIYFAADDQQLFGWLLRPKAAVPPGLGLVICNPFGYEAVSAHGSIRVFAEVAAARGVPSLRFDYAGTGDSADLDPGADQIEIWIQNIIAAARELQRCTGVARVCLLGFRLGAMLAALAAARSPTIDALIAIAPVVSGRRYVRELRTLQLVSAHAHDTEAESGPADDGTVVAGGFSLSAASVGTLRGTELLHQTHAPATDVLIIDRVDLPVARAWAEEMAGLGARVEVFALSGLVEMMMTAPYFTVAPEQMLTTMCQWLGRLQATGAKSRSLPDMADSDPGPKQLRLPTDAGGVTGTVTERPVFFAANPALFGIVAEPGSSERRRRGVIFVNDGATHHIGSNRMNVSLARRWAARGYVVLRMDLAGIGDSAARPGRPANEVFPPDAIKDIRAAIDFLHTQYGIRDISLAGLCSGAYHSLRAAAAALPISRVFMINPQNYFWKEGMALTDLQLAEVVHNPGVYRERVWSGAAWRKLLGGNVNVWRIASVYIHRARLTMESLVRDAARRVGVRLPLDLGWELEEIGARGVHMIFVFARGDPGIDLLRIQAGSSIRRLGQRARVHVIDGADHIFSRKAARELLENLLSEELFARNASTEPELYTADVKNAH